MGSERVLKLRLELLKNRVYEQLNELRNEIAGADKEPAFHNGRHRPDGCGWDRSLKYNRHRKALKRTGTYPARSFYKY